ncbi:hypothetical protein M758_2G135900 [Ceratodon purpureus]|nr:hypothetical protein M758_2G135900 [Ceratodon purpureus]
MYEIALALQRAVNKHHSCIHSPSIHEANHLQLNPLPTLTHKNAPKALNPSVQNHQLVPHLSQTLRHIIKFSKLALNHMYSSWN